VATTLTKTATLLSVDNSGNGTWQIEILRGDVPGFYEIASVTPVGAGPSFVGTFAIVNEVRGLDLTGPGFIPDIVEVSEGMFTMFETDTFQFVDSTGTQLNMPPGSTQSYEVTVRGIPLIDQIQAYVSGFDVRSYGSDVLIKAPIPCFVQLSFIIAKKNTQADPDLTAIATALAAEINGTDFVGRLYAGRLQAIVNGFLAAGMSAGAIDMFGRILGPDNINRFVRATDVLIVPDMQSLMISERTVQFFSDPTQIAISVRTDVPVPS
jgi:hypothetical protein